MARKEKQNEKLSKLISAPPGGFGVLADFYNRGETNMVMRKKKLAEQQPYHPKLRNQILLELKHLWLEYECMVAVGDEESHSLVDFIDFVKLNIEKKSEGFKDIVRIRPPSERG